jgi:hypothetical protein
VIPASSAFIGDTGGAGAPISGEALTTQFVYGSSLLNNLPIGSQINGIFFRLVERDPTGPVTNFTYNNFNITMSQSLKAPGSLSMTFEDNIGPGASLVRSGSLTISAGSYPGGLILNPFGPEIAFTTPYRYMGGDLLFTIRASSIASISNNPGNLITAYAGGSGSMQTVGGLYNDASAVFGINSSPVLQLDYSPFAASVPEPSSLALMGLGTMGLIGWVCKRRKQLARK